MIDKMFYCKNNIEYHCICPNCNQYVKEFDKFLDNMVTCNVCLKEFLVKDLTFTDFFVIIDPETEIIKNLEQNDLFYNDIMNNIRQDSTFEFYTEGLYKQFRN